MYIACPNCQTNFIIEPGLLQPNGRKLKCSKCRHIWHKDAPKASEIAAKMQKNIVKRPIETSYNLPVVIDSPKNWPIAGIILPFVLALIVFFIVIFNHILKTTDPKRGQGFFINVVKTEKNKQDNILLVKYKISNFSDHAKQIPYVRFLFSDDRANIVDFQIIKEKVILQPHNYIYITSGFQDYSKKIANFDINF
jgi:predicted Zn finger-like uncharacterized protein